MDLVLQHLRQTGRADVAARLCQEAGIKPCAHGDDDDDNDDALFIIRQQILQRNIPSAVSTINDAFPGLLVRDRALQLELELQHLINQLGQENELGELILTCQQILQDMDTTSPDDKTRMGEVLALLVLPRPATSELFLKSPLATAIKVNSALNSHRPTNLSKLVDLTCSLFPPGSPPGFT
ncbi:hypothetical protein BASA81_006163 [Batrachochytrium salamandrivorans]|nr:hypothetical protein BASA81_006163 [Batrachochytrium salamandrivorans]